MCTCSRLLYTSLIGQWEVFFRVVFRSGWLYVLFQYVGVDRTRLLGGYQCPMSTNQPSTRWCSHGQRGLGGREGARMSAEDNPCQVSCHSTHPHGSCDTDRFGTVHSWRSDVSRSPCASCGPNTWHTGVLFGMSGSRPPHGFRRAIRKGLVGKGRTEARTRVQPWRG